MKGSITASCGHVLADDEEGHVARTLDTGCDFEGIYTCVTHSHVCNACYERLRTSGELATPEEAALWISKGVLPYRMSPLLNN